MNFATKANPTFLFLLILFSFSAQASASELNYYIKTISEPYTNFFQTVEHHISHHKDIFSQFLTNDQPEYPEVSSSSVRPQLPIIENYIDQDDDLEPLTSHFRNLATINCSNGGVPVSTQRFLYYCNGIRVSKTNYYNADGPTNPNCFTNKTAIDVCYCPWDYYGRFCDNFIGITADVIQLNFLQDCTGQSDFKYTYEYGGLAPCYKVSIGDSLDMRYKIVLQPERPDLAGEGIKIPQYETDPVPEPANFTYEVEGPNVNLSSFPANLTFNFHLIDFNYLSISKDFSVPLNKNQLDSNEPVSVTVFFDQGTKNLAKAGRYYFETSLTDEKEKDISNKGYLGTFEVPDYKEPPPVHKKNLKILIIVLSIVVAVMIAAGAWYWMRKRKRIEQEMVQKFIGEEIGQENEETSRLK